ncbi:lamin tail domain-containing protein [Roseiconus lacunae]|uniref:lamin tail domain-containing protein n=1 Tax=Roseiconus lacunae TaxID=2605694 RepID=UPI0011F0FB01|nr:lamin tail domain-containing protein [Roseiconus lacunae]
MTVCVASRVACSRTLRRLRGEPLEQRLCLSAVRIVSWNTANAPNSPTEDAYFSTVFEAIGDEVVVGNSMPPSIIALQETDNAELGGNSIARIETLLESLYPQKDFGRAVTTLDSGDDATGFVYDTGIFDLVSTSVVAQTPGMQAFAHRIMRGQFRPIGSDGQSDFYLYTTHLKAGSSGGNASRRTAEANAIRLDIDSLGDHQDVIVMGDFNISGSSEGAYQNFLRSGTGQLFDPIDTPGQWKNDPRYIDIHTQNPAINGAGGMDDRYDFQLASAAVFDDEGLQYIDGSYRAFGNDGTHTFNSDITTGSGASPGVLGALAAASDHLPVVVDYEIDVVVPGIYVNTGGSDLRLTEGGDSVTYEVSLRTVPDADVQVTIATDGQTQVNGSGQVVLTFTPGDALVPQTVSIGALENSESGGTAVSRITHSAVSSDLTYQSVDEVSLSVRIDDNDAASVVISEVMYNPAGDEPDGEWIEIANLGPGAVDLSGWQLDDEDPTDWSPIPDVSPLPPGQVAILHNDAVDSADFRDRWSIPPEAMVIGLTWGSLSNSPTATNESLELLDATGAVQDIVPYDDDGSSWPMDNNASSIYLSDVRLDNSIGDHWLISNLGVDQARHPSGSPLSPLDVGSPGFAPGLQIDPPRVVETRVAGQRVIEGSRSVVRSLTVVFDRIVSVQPGAIQILRDGIEDLQEASVGLAMSARDVIDHTEITLTFSGNLSDATGSLIDGRYRLRIDASMVTSGGIALDGDNNERPGGDYRFGEVASDRFFRLFGDRDGDQDVDQFDLRHLGGLLATQSFDEAFDADDDGDLDLFDLAELRRRL